MPISLLLTLRSARLSIYHEFSKATGLFIVLFYVAALANAQSLPPEKQWDKTFGGNREDRLFCQVSAPDGGYLLGGTSWSGISGDATEGDFGLHSWILKIDMNGKKQWDHNFIVRDALFIV